MRAAVAPTLSARGASPTTSGAMARMPEIAAARRAARCRPGIDEQIAVLCASASMPP